MTDTAPTTTPKGILAKLSSDTLLSVLVALLSVLTALAAYQGSIADSQEGDFNVEGQKQLTEANALYLESNQFVIYDFTMYDGWYVNDGVNQENAEYYYTSFSEELSASIERPDGPFDDLYYEGMYADAESLYDEALGYFDQAQAAGDRANQMQLVVLVFAVGLALSAYASLMQPEKMIRGVFAASGFLALVMGLLSYFAA